MYAQEETNSIKRKELIIDFKKSKNRFNSISVDSKELELVDHAKILGVTIASTLQWNYHIHEVIRKLRLISSCIFSFC